MNIGSRPKIEVRVEERESMFDCMTVRPVRVVDVEVRREARRE